MYQKMCIFAGAIPKLMEKKFSTPILLLIFNRPDAVKRLIEHLRPIQPTKIYVGADGPRLNKPNDQEKCNQSQLALKKIDWNCDIITHFREDNLGCRNAINDAIDWFFSKEEKGIILEDDCLPDASFFEYASILLDKYKDNNQVMHIAGDNPIEHITNSYTNSYTFTQMPLVWGWATWREAWAKMNLSLDGLEQADFSKLPLDTLSQKYIKEKFGATQKRENDSWAYAWYFSILQNDGICIIPKVNLVKNIGFGAESTHTKSANKTRELDSHALSFPLQHPTSLKINPNIEQQLFYSAQKSKIGLYGRFWVPKFIRRLLGAQK